MNYEDWKEMDGNYERCLGRGNWLDHHPCTCEEDAIGYPNCAAPGVAMPCPTFTPEQTADEIRKLRGLLDGLTSEGHQ